MTCLCLLLQITKPHSGNPLRKSFDETATPISKFLGAHHTFEKQGHATHHSVQMREFLQDAALKYKQETGISTLAPVRTPYLPENFSAKGEEAEGKQAKTCSSHLMKLLFAARLARPTC